MERRSRCARRSSARLDSRSELNKPLHLSAARPANIAELPELLRKA